MNNELPLKLLWLVPKSPYPAEDGARLATSILLKHLTESGHKIDLVILDGENNTNSTKDSISKIKESFNLENVIIIPRKSSSGNVLFRIIKSIPNLILTPKVPITFQPFVSSKIKDALNSILQGMTTKLKNLEVEAESFDITPKWDALVFDGLHVASYLYDGTNFNIPEYYPPIIYRAHNVEVDLWKGKIKGEKNDIKKKLLLNQAGLVQDLELALLRKVNLACTVSNEDGERLKEILPRLNTSTVPIGFNFPNEPLVKNVIEKYFIFIGRLDWPPNRDGLIWFLNEIWPEIKSRGDYKLKIIGHGKAEYLNKFKQDASIEIAGFVKSLKEEYLKATAAIVPIFYGSGTRVKIIEAASYGCPVISTKLGAQGLGLLADISYFEAERPIDWINHLTNTSIELFNKVGLTAYQDLKNNNDPIQAAKIFSDSTREAIKLKVIVRNSSNSLSKGY